MRTEFDTRADEPCQTWKRGDLTGSVYHIIWPLAVIGDTMFFCCDRCGKDLGTVDFNNA